MAKSIIKNSRKVHAGPSTDPSLDNRVYYLENNEYKITYYEIVSGTSGTLTVPTGATINEGEFGASGNAILSEIGITQKPTFKTPQTAGGVAVTASLNHLTGAWLSSGVYTSSNVALIYSISILAKDYQNLDYSKIIESEELDYDIATQGAVDTGTVNDQIVTPKTFENAAKWGTTLASANTYADGKVIDSIADADTTHAPSRNAVFDALTLKEDTLTGARLASLGHAATQKAVLVDADELTGQDSANSFSYIRTTLLNIFSYIAKKFENKTNGGNAAYSILTTDNVIYTGTALTAPRTWTLPLAASVNPGHEKIVADFLQTVTSTNTLTIGVQSGEYLNGVLNGTEVMSAAGGQRRLISDGVTGWYTDLGIVRLASTQTLTNKTIKKRILVVTQSATPSTNIDNGDIVQITGLAQAITSMTTNLTGTPYDGQMIMWQITDNGTARAITWGASFASTTGSTLPTTTVISTLLRVLTQYNSATGKHECIATG